MIDKLASFLPRRSMSDQHDSNLQGRENKISCDPRTEGRDYWMSE
jgi:hypothetical protein